MKLKNCAISIAILLGGCALALKAYKKYANKANQPASQSDDNADSDVAVVNMNSAYDSYDNAKSMPQSLSTLNSFAESAEQSTVKSPAYSESVSAIQKDIDSKNADLDSLNHLSKNKPSSVANSDLFSNASSSDDAHSASFRVSRVNGSLSVENKSQAKESSNEVLHNRHELQEYQCVLEFINKYNLDQINLSYVKYAFNISQKDAKFIINDMQHKDILEPRHDSLLDTIYKIHRQNIPLVLHTLDLRLDNK